MRVAASDFRLLSRKALDALLGLRESNRYLRGMVQWLGFTVAEVPFQPDPVFGVLVPQTCPGVPPELLHPRDTWKDPAAYDQRSRQLASLFR